MKLIFVKPELTCTSLETELGLNPGDLVEITAFPDGTVEIDTVVDLTAVQKDTIKSLFGLIEKVG